MEHMDIFRERLNVLMEKEGISRRALAKEIGISRNGLDKIVNEGTESIRSDTLLELSKYFGVSTDYLLGLKDSESNNYKLNEISKKTGLSVSSLQKLEKVKIEQEKRWKEDDDKNIPHRTDSVLSTLDEIIQYYEFELFMYDLRDYFDLLLKYEMNSKASTQYSFSSNNLVEFIKESNIQDLESFFKKVNSNNIYEDEFPFPLSTYDWYQPLLKHSDTLNEGDMEYLKFKRIQHDISRMGENRIEFIQAKINRIENDIKKCEESMSREEVILRSQDDLNNLDFYKRQYNKLREELKRERIHLKHIREIRKALSE